jgi:hypothetical protein
MTFLDRAGSGRQAKSVPMVTQVSRPGWLCRWMCLSLYRLRLVNTP